MILDPDAPALTQVVSTAATVSGAVVALGVFVVRALIARDVRPLADQIIRLEGKIDTLAAALTADRATRLEERRDARETAAALDHRVRELEMRPARPA